MGDLLWLAALLFLGRRDAAASTSSRPSTSPPRRTVPGVAYLYRLPDDGYETTRVAVALQPDDAAEESRPVERAIMSSEANALQLVRDNGWALAWPGVRELQDRP